MKRFIFSSIGKKIILSLTGAFLMIFLLLHVSLNLTALYSRELYAAVCEFMDKSLLVQIMVPVLASGFIFHIVFSIWIELRNCAARPRSMRYRVPCKAKTASWASNNMLVLGLVVLGFLALHFFHFWSKMQLQHMLGHDGASAYDLVVATFSKWYYCVLYIIWLAAISYHVSHGLWSAFQTLGMNNKAWLPRLKMLGKIYAVIIFLAYIIIPIYFYLGLYKE